MKVTEYQQTVQLSIDLTTVETTIVDEIRRQPHGQYWDSDAIDLNSLTLGELVTLSTTLDICLGTDSQRANVFAPGKGEVAEDVIGNGDFATPAEDLADDFHETLLKWHSTVELKTD